MEDWNEAVMGFISDHPKYLLTGVGLGNIHLYAQKYIPDYALHYMADNVFVAKSGFLRILSETGIIGFLLFLISCLKPITSLFKFRKKDDLILLSIIIGVYSLIDFFLSWDGPNYIFLFLGIIYSIYLHKTINGKVGEK